MEATIQVEQHLFNYIDQNAHVDRNRLTPQTMLFRGRIFDSMGFVFLSDFIEENYKVKGGTEDVFEENFKSVHPITRFIQKKVNP